MNCHYPEGRGKGWFTTAGTISGTPDGTTVHVTNSVGATQVIEVDALGNFFTTDAFEYANGVTVSVQKNGVTHQMQGQIKTGQCNLCHGVTTNPLSF